MTPLMTAILAIQLLCALTMIGLILVQQGKGADAGAAFGGGGGGASGSLFGATGSANFLSRSTAVLATVFFVCTLALAYLSNVTPQSIGSVLEGATVPTPAQQIPGSTGPANPADVPAPSGLSAPPAGGDASVPPPAQGSAPAGGQGPSN